MRFVAPGGNAGALHHLAHGAAVVGAVQQKRLDQRRIARHKAAAHARHIAALRQAGEGDQVFEVHPPQLRGSFQPTQRRLVAEINLAVALVRGDHKAMAVTQVKQLLPLRQGHHRAGGVAW